MKGNEAYTNMLSNSLHTPLTHEVGQKCHCFFLSESSHVAYQNNGNEAENTMQSNSLPFYKPTALGFGEKVKACFYLKKCHIAYQIKRKEV